MCVCVSVCDGEQTNKETKSLMDQTTEGMERDASSMHTGPAHLDLEHELVASDAELGLKQDGELLLRDRLRPAPVRSLDPL